jgi:hypothetical protein
MITRHSLLLAGGIDPLVERQLSRVEAAASIIGGMPQVRVSDHLQRAAETEGLLK